MTTLNNFTGANCVWIPARRMYKIRNGILQVTGAVTAPPGGWPGVTVLMTREQGDTGGGGITFGAGASGVIGDGEVPVLFIEDQFAKPRLADNYKRGSGTGNPVDNTGDGARFAGGTTNTLILDHVFWFVDTRSGRSDFDFAQGDSNKNGPAVTVRGLRLFITSGANHSFNHIASKNVKVEIGSNVDYGLWVTDTVSPASLELTSGLLTQPKGIILDDTYPQSGNAQFAVQPDALPENGWLEVSDLKTRSVSVVSGGTNTDTRGLRFINLVGLPEREAWSNQYAGNLEVQRDQRFELDNAVDGRVYADAQHASSADVDEAIDSSGVSTLRLITQVSADAAASWTDTNTFKFHAVGRSFRKYYSGDTAITLDNAVPVRKVAVTKDEFPNGDAIAAYTGSAGVATASELYRVIKDFELDNAAVPSLGESIATINSNGHIVLGASMELRLSTTAADLVSVSSGVMTVKVNSNGITADKGITLLDAGTANAVPATTRGFIKMPLRDSSGTSSQLSIAAHANERVGVYTSTGTSIGSYAYTADGSHTFQVDATKSAANTRIGLVRAGYAYVSHGMDLSAGGAFAVEFDALRQELGPDGTPVYKGSADTTNAEAVTFGDTGEATIDIGDGWADVEGIYKKFHDEVDTADGTKFAAFNRERLGIAVDALAGNSLYLGANIKLRRYESGDINAAVRAGVYSSGDAVDETNGTVIIKPGSDIARIQKALLKDFDLDDSEAGTQSVASLLVKIDNCSSQMAPAMEELQDKLDITAGVVAGKATAVVENRRVVSSTFRDLDDTRDVRTIGYGNVDGVRESSTTPPQPDP